MPEAVIVATARTPIGRAVKGSLIDVRPDDLAATDRAGRPGQGARPGPARHRRPDARLRRAGGEAGLNMARRVAVALGYDILPGTTVNRFCASSVQTSRMAFHAIKAGEGHVFVSAGVECVSQLPGVQRGRRRARGVPRTRLRRGAGPHRRRPPASNETWHDPREDGLLPDVYIAMGQTAENLATLARHQPGRAGRVRRPLAEPGREGDRRRLLRPRDHAGHDARRHRGRRGTTARAPGVTLEGVAGLQAGVPRGRARSPPATAARSTTAPRPS